MGTDPGVCSRAVQLASLSLRETNATSHCRVARKTDTRSATDQFTVELELKTGFSICEFTENFSLDTDRTCQTYAWLGMGKVVCNEWRSSVTEPCDVINNHFTLSPSQFCEQRNRFYTIKCFITHVDTVGSNA